MRDESEIVAMRDKLERYALHHYCLSDQGHVVLAALMWAADPLIGDGELLGLAEDGDVARYPDVPARPGHDLIV